MASIVTGGQLIIVSGNMDNHHKSKGEDYLGEEREAKICKTDCKFDCGAKVVVNETSKPSKITVDERMVTPKSGDNITKESTLPDETSKSSKITTDEGLITPKSGDNITKVESTHPNETSKPSRIAADEGLGSPKFGDNITKEELTDEPWWKQGLITDEEAWENRDLWYPLGCQWGNPDADEEKPWVPIYPKGPVFPTPKSPGLDVPTYNVADFSEHLRRWKMRAKPTRWMTPLWPWGLENSKFLCLLMLGWVGFQKLWK